MGGAQPGSGTARDRRSRRRAPPALPRALARPDPKLAGRPLFQRPVALQTPPRGSDDLLSRPQRQGRRRATRLLQPLRAGHGLPPLGPRPPPARIPLTPEMYAD